MRPARTVTERGPWASGSFLINCNSIRCRPDCGRARETWNGAHTRLVQNDATYPFGTPTARNSTVVPGVPLTLTPNFEVPGTLPGSTGPV